MRWEYCSWLIDSGAFSGGIPWNVDEVALLAWRGLSVQGAVAVVTVVGVLRIAVE